MKNTDLEDLLKKAQLPIILDDSVEAFTDSVIARLDRQELAGVTAPRRSLRLGWALAVIILAVMVFSVGHRHSVVQTRTKEFDDCLANIDLIRQTMMMFPNRVRAIVDDGNGWKLLLAENEDVPASPPIYVRICDGSHCSSLVTFSGQVISVAGKRLTVLSDPRGEIILMGDRFVWSSRKQLFAGNHLTIEAKNIGPATL